MTERTIGYIELEWVCPVCKNRNPGPEKICKGCGAAQPEDVQFEAPLQQTLIKEIKDDVQNKQVIERAKKGPDRHCPYCDARNPADAKKCSQCEADLSEAKSRSAGNVVGPYQAGQAAPIICATCGSANPASATTCANCGASIRKPNPATVLPTRQQQGMSMGFFFVLCGAVLLVVFWLLFMMMHTTEVSGKVQRAEWTRTVDIQALVPVQEQAWEDEIPADVRSIGQCTSALRDRVSNPVAGAKEVCGKPYTEDTGSGYGKVKQECWYEIYDDLCEYTVERWRTIDSVSQHGEGFEPFWPEINLSFNQRAGNRNESYQCSVLANDQIYTYSASGLNDYLLCQPGQQVQVNINGFGSITSLQSLQ